MNCIPRRGRIIILLLWENIYGGEIHRRNGCFEEDLNSDHSKTYSPLKNIDRILDTILMEKLLNSGISSKRTLSNANIVVAIRWQFPGMYQNWHRVFKSASDIKILFELNLTRKKLYLHLFFPIFIIMIYYLRVVVTDNLVVTVCADFHNKNKLDIILWKTVKMRVVFSTWS